MRTTTIALAAILAVATIVPAMAETAEELKTQINQVDRNLQDAIRRTTQGIEAQQLRDAMSAAQKALADTAATLPAVKKIDEKITKARKDLVDLQKQRMELVAKSPDLASARQTAETARQAYQRATAENTQLSALRAQRMELVKKLMELSRPVIPTPGPKE